MKTLQKYNIFKEFNIVYDIKSEIKTNIYMPPNESIRIIINNVVFNKCKQKKQFN